jgi:hypothetical protein
VYPFHCITSPISLRPLTCNILQPPAHPRSSLSVVARRGEKQHTLEEAITSVNLYHPKPPHHHSSRHRHNPNTTPHLFAPCSQGLERTDTDGRLHLRELCLIHCEFRCRLTVGLKGYRSELVWSGVAEKTSLAEALSNKSVADSARVVLTVAWKQAVMVDGTYRTEMSLGGGWRGADGKFESWGFSLWVVGWIGSRI